MPTELVVLAGAGGHAKVVYDAILRGRLARRVEVRDDDPNRADTPFLGVSVRTPIGEPAVVHIAIGGNLARSAVAARLAGRTLFTVVHPDASVSERCEIDPGVFVAAGAVVAVAARVCECAIINHCAVIDHDCVVGPYAHVAPNATLGGGTKVGEGALVGAGAVLLPGVSVGRWAVVGAGAVVVRSIGDGEIVYGVPAKNKRNA